MLAEMANWCVCIVCCADITEYIKMLNAREVFFKA